MLICDTHADTLFSMGRKSELDVTADKLRSPGNTRVQALALYVGSHGLKGEDAGLIERELENFRLLLSQGWHQIRRISEALPDVPNALLTIEGGEAFGANASSVEKFADLGVKIAALVWNNENLLAHSAVSGSKEGLKPYGKEIASLLRAQHIALDISHLNEAGAAELMDASVPPMASHSCARALCDHPRNLTDDQLKKLFRAGGYVGVNFYPAFLKRNGKASVSDVADHIAYMCDLGGENCIGLGSDFDGIETYPKGLRHAGELSNLFYEMEARGFGKELIEAIAGKNLERYLDLVDDAV